MDLLKIAPHFVFEPYAKQFRLSRHEEDIWGSLDSADLFLIQELGQVGISSADQG